MHQIMKKTEVIFFKRINTWISQNASNLDNIILCGDFNCQLDVNNIDKCAGTLKKILKMIELNDC